MFAPSSTGDVSKTMSLEMKVPSAKSLGGGVGIMSVTEVASFCMLASSAVGRVSFGSMAPVSSTRRLNERTVLK